MESSYNRHTKKCELFILIFWQKTGQLLASKRLHQLLLKYGEPSGYFRINETFDKAEK